MFLSPFWFRLSGFYQFLDRERGHILAKRPCKTNKREAQIRGHIKNIYTYVQIKQKSSLFHIMHHFYFFVLTSLWTQCVYL